jgi:biopolymer transport protein ExbB
MLLIQHLPLSTNLLAFLTPNSISVFSWGGVVLIPLFGFSLLAIALILERLLFWVKIPAKHSQLMKVFFREYPENQLLAIEKLKQNLDLPLARIFLTALELGEGNSARFQLALETAAQAEIPLLKRFNTVFETIINVSPLLGLLGTILGLMEAFASLKIGDLGGTSTTGVSAGISEALVTTAVGLVVAIFTLLFANLFRGLYRRQLALIQRYGGQLELLYTQDYISPTG